MMVEGEEKTHAYECSNIQGTSLGNGAILKFKPFLGSK